MSAQDEKTVGCLIYGGIALIPIGLVVTFILMTGGALRYMRTGGQEPGLLALRGIGPGLVVLGIAMAAGGIFYGMAMNRRQRTGTGRVTIDPYARVMAKYGYNSAGEMVTSDWQFEGDEITYYVKMQLSDGKVMDFETRREVFDFCPEGMMGEAHFDRGWLGKFVPRVGGAPPPVPY